MHQSGEFAALLTAVFWTVTALAFESATKRVGTYAVNIIRLCIAFVLLSLLNQVLRGHSLPSDATSFSWFWLSISGLIGFVLGDLFLFGSYPLIGSRLAMLVMTLVPPMTTVIGKLMLHEDIHLKGIIGMLLVLTGIIIAIISRENGKTTFKSGISVKGLVFAFLGAVGQAFGLVTSKYGMGEYNAFASTQIRTIAGIIGFVVLITIMRKWNSVFLAFNDKNAIKGISLGAFFGPFLGVSFSLIAIKYTETGIASTIMAIVPVLIIAPSILINKQKVSLREIIGAVVSVCGVALLFL